MTRSALKTPGLLLAAVCALAATPPDTAHAFCGFFVSGSNDNLYNEATHVVMMREGRRTVLSLQNDYQGPAEDFAMVVPVPVVLHRENVKTLNRAVFDHVDRLGAPRLVEYWEQDPCYQPPLEREEAIPMALAGTAARSRRHAPRGLGVRVEARFAVGEYDVVILSARYSAGLETWLHQNHYNIPNGAERVLRPYVQAGTKFFVAKVNIHRVHFEGQRAVLSPLRFYYDSDEFSLPVRLGLLNSHGKQDLIVNILARGKRYQVANYRNVTIPTNFQVSEDVRHDFGGFYSSLFDRTLEQNPGTVVTEYAWDADSCDPCPTPALGPNDLAALGTDVLSDHAGSAPQLLRLRPHAAPLPLRAERPRPGPGLPGGAGHRRGPRLSRREREDAPAGPVLVDQQLPGPLLDPASVAGADHVRAPDPWALGKPPERRPAGPDRRRRAHAAAEVELRIPRSHGA